MAFSVKSSSRPNIKYDLEDVNYYNYRTKVMTKTTFEPMTMTFHDDTLNLATQFYHAYMRAMSPITGIDATGAQSDMLEQGGMEFENRTLLANQIVNQIPASTYAASSGTLADDRKQVFSEIRLYHLFDAGNRMNVWRFFNPRLNTLGLDDLDMSIGNEGSQITISFDYDSIFLDPDVSLGSDNKYNLKQTQRGSVYPLRYNGTITKGNAPTTAAPDLGSIPGSLAETITKSPIYAAGKAAVSAVGDLSTKFSNALGSLPFGGG